MPRIRTIKPEFYQDEDLARVSEPAFILAAGLLNHADDEGYFRAHPGLIKAAVFPLREPSVSIPRMLDELSRAGYITLFEVPVDKIYGLINGFTAHQRVNRPTPSRIKQLELKKINSLNAHGILTEDSPPERKGKDRKGREPPVAPQNAKSQTDREIDIEFDTHFWPSWPKKLAREQARKTYRKIKKSPDAPTLEEILRGVEAAIRLDRRFQDPQFTPYASTWLNSGGWHDEHDPREPCTNPRPTNTTERSARQAEHDAAELRAALDSGDFH